MNPLRKVRNVTLVITFLLYLNRKVIYLPSMEKPSHYEKLKIDPYEYAMANGLDFAQGSIIKYVTRFRDKNGVEDLKKAIFAIERLIDYENTKRSGRG